MSMSTSSILSSSLIPVPTFRAREKLTINHPLSVGNLSISGVKSRKYCMFKARRPFSPVMEWQDCKAKVEIGVPCSVAFICFSDREATPRWLPLISSVKVLEEKPDLSLWLMSYKAFGYDLEFSWLARTMKPIPNQKLHWHSLEGLPNKGAVRFHKKSPSSCIIELNISYEVPFVLSPLAPAIRPYIEGLLITGLKRFSQVVKEDYREESCKI